MFGVGPQIVYNTELLRRPVIFNLHNYQEFGAVNRFEGNVTTFAATFEILAGAHKPVFIARGSFGCRHGLHSRSPFQFAAHQKRSRHDELIAAAS